MGTNDTYEITLVPISFNTAPIQHDPDKTTILSSNYATINPYT